MMNYKLLVSLPLFLSFVPTNTWADDPAAGTSVEPKTTTVSFIAEVAPLLRDHCLACHGPKKAEGGYRVDTYTELLKSGDSGELPISDNTDTPHELLRRITTDDPYERMPAEADRLESQTIDVLSRWLDQGAKFDGHDPNVDLNTVIPATQFPTPPASYRPVPVTALAFSPDGQYLVSGGYHELLVWDTKTPGPPRRIGNVDQRVFGLAWLSDQKTLVVGGGQPGKSGEVRLIDFESGNVLATSKRMTDVVLDIAVSPISEQTPTSTLIAVAIADGTTRLLDAANLTEVKLFATHADWVTAVAWSPDGKRIASASKDKSAKVINVESGELEVNYQAHAAAVRGVMFSPDGQHVLSTGADNKLHRWKADSGEKVAEVGLGGEPFKIISAGGTVLVTNNNLNLIRIDLSNNAISQNYSGHLDWVIDAAFHEASGKIASGSIAGEIRLWNAAEGGLIHQWLCQP